MKKNISFISFLLIVLLSSSCNTAKTYPAPSSENAYPGPSTSINSSHDYTVTESVPIATIKAKDWNQDAVLYAVFPSLQMSHNLGLPGISPGWFFMFKVPGNPIEFYIQVLNGEITGSTKAQPILGEQLPYQYQPLNINKIKINSDEAFLFLLEKETSLNSDSNRQIDYRLIHLEGQENPVWTLFRIEGDELIPLIHIDAITGLEVTDPFSTY